MVTPERRRTAGRGGFTMAEMMVVVAIIGIIGSIAPKFFIEVNRFFLMNRTRLELQKASREALVLITRNLRQASTATLRVDRLNSSQPHYSRVTFTKVDGRVFSFYQSGTNLMMTVTGMTNAKTLSKDLYYLTFTFPRSDNMDILSVAMTFRRNIFEGKHKALHLASEKVRIMNP